MLYVSATLSLLMLATVIVVVARGGKPRGGTITVVALIAFGPILLPMQFLSVIIQFFLLLVLLVAGSYWRFAPRTYVIAACACALSPYLLFGLVQGRDLANLRERFPYESLETRLPTRRRADRTAKPPGLSPDVLNDADAEVQAVTGRQAWQRVAALETLHEHTVSAFVNSPGFGVSRMPVGVSEEVLKWGTKSDSAHPQPVPKTLEETSAGYSEPLAQPSTSDFASLHRASYLDFADPQGFGYFKDRAHVAGFRSHQFSKAPAANAGWKLQTVELVGLILHKDPIVYVSDSLPRMDALRKATVRQLDAFEAPGLDRLKDGQSLFVRKQGDRLRVLGALRAASQCTACHDCERGELLGAFSYVLRRQ